MAQYQGIVQGSRGEASRLGHKTSGLTAIANGWHVGARVELSHEDGRDVVRVYRTHGSHSGAGELLLSFDEDTP